MTLQDLVGTINDTLLSFGQTFSPFFVPLFAAILTILIGISIATLITRVIQHLSDLLSIEKSLQKLVDYKKLGKLNQNFTLTILISQITWTITLLIFVFAALQLSGFRETNKVLKIVADFLPRVVEGSLLLLLGIVLAYFAFVLTSIVGTLGKFPYITIFSKSLAAVILIFSGYQAILAFGLTNELIRFLTIGFIAAFSLALALGAKDIVSQTIKNIWNQKL